ncbi:MAG: hypothetical protein J1F71_03730 [Clostridiales bacterium]|nr:hypothetical protein [Clostridiales bacterium]
MVTANKSMEGGKQKCSTVADAAIYSCSCCFAAAAAETTVVAVAKRALIATIYCYSTFSCAAAAEKINAAANPYIRNPPSLKAVVVSLCN